MNRRFLLLSATLLSGCSVLTELDTFGPPDAYEDDAPDAPGDVSPDIPQDVTMDDSQTDSDSELDSAMDARDITVDSSSDAGLPESGDPCLESQSICSTDGVARWFCDPLDDSPRVELCEARCVDGQCLDACVEGAGALFCDFDGDATERLICDGGGTSSCPESPTQQECVGGSCRETVECTPGAQRCDGSTMVMCDPSGRFEIRSSCGDDMCIQLWPDADDDGRGDWREPPIIACGVHEGWIDNSDDCDDFRPGPNPDGVSPGNEELPNDGIDSDCDGYEWISAPGVVSIGSPETEPDRDPAFEEAHQVNLTLDLMVGVTEVTRGDWERVMGELPGRQPECADDVLYQCPVSSISFAEALVFANAISISEGLEPCYTINAAVNEADFGSGCNGTICPDTRLYDVTSFDFDLATCTGYRLPTEAEWEHFARASASNTDATHGPIDAVAWHQETSGRTVHATAQLDPNAFGLHDVLGNVSEPTMDYFGAYEFDDTPAENPFQDTDPGSGIGRVIRGGHFSSIPSSLRLAARTFGSSRQRNANQGLRLVRIVVIETEE